MTAVNAQSRVITEYGTDPAEGTVRGLIGSLIARAQGRLGQKAVVGFDGDPMTTLGGYANSPQHFQGAAGRIGAPVTIRDGGFPEMSSGVPTGPMYDPVRRILAARMRAGRDL